MPWRIWGNVIAGVHCFSPLGFWDQKPGCQERQRLMLLPARPIAHLIVGQTRFALAALYTVLDAMCGFRHTGKLPQRGLRRSVGQVIIDLHPLLVVAIAVAHDHHPLLVALLPSVRARHHASFDPLDHQGAFRAIADINPLPDVITERLAPLLHALPGTLGPAP